MRELFQEEFDRGAGEVVDPSPPPPAVLAPIPAADPPLPPPVADQRAPVPAAPLPSLGGERLPACLEPWKSLYILRRGVLPCCYGGRPIAPMEDHREAWNGPLMQSIRAELVAGRFHDYCLSSPACPIVRKSAEAHTLPVGQRALLGARRLWTRLDRRLGGLPGRTWGPVKRGARVVRRTLAAPHRAAGRLVRRARGTGPS